jgi:hypothetical protein
LRETNFPIAVPQFNLAVLICDWRAPIIPENRIGNRTVMPGRHNYHR